MTQISNTQSSEINYYRELLSVLSDGELSEKELSDLLNVFRQKNELSDTLASYWSRLCATRQLLKGEGLFNLYVDSDDFVALKQKLETYVDYSNVVPISGKKTQVGDSLKLSVLQNLSIAASVMFAVLFGWMLSQQPVREAVMASLLIDTQTTTEQVEAQLPTNFPRINYSQQVVNVSLNGKSKEIVKEQSLHLSDQRIASYMRYHAENASLNSNHGMLPFARISQVQKEF